MLYPDDRTQEHPALLSDLVYVHIIPYLHMSDIAFMQKGPYYDEWKNPSAAELRC